MTKSRFTLWFAAVATALTSFASDFQIRDGDRVVFLGDSITEQRLYTTYIEAYALTRHPEWKLSFRNVGWGGDTSWLRQRARPNEEKLFAAKEETLDKMVEDSVARGLGRDVLPLNPTFVTVKFGMNDHSYQKFRPDIFRAYVRSQSEISKVLKRAGARVALLTPQPIEERRPNPDQDDRNLALKKFSDGLKEVASNTGATFVDQFDPFMSLMMSARAKAPDAFIGGGDAVHPGPSGQTLMAWAVLKGLGATALVSTAEIDVGGKSAKAQGCRIENLTVDGQRIQFDRLDNALPWPVDERAVAALKLAPLENELSRYELKVAGLAEGDYELKIDGESAGKISSATLAEGWNLSSQAGPITKQSRDLLKSVFRKNELFFNRWRNVQLYNFPNWATGSEVEMRRTLELQRLDDEIAKAESQIEGLRKLRSHRFDLTRVDSTGK